MERTRDVLAVDLAAMAETFGELRADAAATLDAEAVPADRRRLTRSADLRYARQGVEIPVEFPGEAVDDAAIARLVDDFHALHERLYTFADRAAPVEIVNLRVTAIGIMDKFEMTALEAVADGTPAPPAGDRRVHLGGGFATVPVYRREALLAGHLVAGPAIVDQLDTTTVVLPGTTATVDAYLNLILEAA